MRSLGLSLILPLVYGLLQVPVNRLIQYEYENNLYGSQVSALNFLGAHYGNPSEVPRKIAVIHASEVSVSVIQNLIKLLPAGILIILPELTEKGQLGDRFALDWKDFEIWAATNYFPFPIYFAQESEEVLQIYSQLKQGTKGQSILEEDQLNFEVKTDEKYKQGRITLENMHGFIYEYSEALPTIAIVTYYDSFSIIPETTQGASDNLSGVAAFLELARIFNNLYNTSPPGYNLLFLLTSAGALNFQGAKSWLASEDPNIQQIINKIVFTLCLDSLAGPEDLTMHVSRFHKEDEIDVARIYKAFNTTAEIQKVSLSYDKKKVNVGDPYVPWMHENFARRRVVAATISRRSGANNVAGFGSVFDTVQLLCLDKLEQTVKFIGDSIASFLYAENQNQLNNGVQVDRDNLANVVEILSNHTTYFATKLVPSSPQIQTLESLLKQYTEGTLSKTQFVLEDYHIFPSKPETLTIYNVKPAILDFYIFLSAIAYITVLYIALSALGSVFVKSTKDKAS